MSDEPIGTTPWRVGRKVGLYDCNDRLIGVVDTPDIASLIVEAVNGFFGKGVEPPIITPPTPLPSPLPGTCGTCGGKRSWLVTWDDGTPRYYQNCPDCNPTPAPSPGGTP